MVACCVPLEASNGSARRASRVLGGSAERNSSMVVPRGITLLGSPIWLAMSCGVFILVSLCQKLYLMVACVGRRDKCGYL